MARYAGKHVYTGYDLSENLDKMNFSRAFAKARQILGPGGVFEWQGKKFTTNWKDESSIPVREGETPMMNSTPPLLRRPHEGVPMQNAQSYGPPSGYARGTVPYNTGTPWREVQSAASPVPSRTPPVQNVQRTVDHFRLQHGSPGYMDTAPEQSILPPLQSEVPLPQPLPFDEMGGSPTNYAQGPWRQYPYANAGGFQNDMEQTLRMSKLRSILGR